MSQRGRRHPAEYFLGLPRDPKGKEEHWGESGGHRDLQEAACHSPSGLSVLPASVPTPASTTLIPPFLLRSSRAKALT